MSSVISDNICYILKWLGIHRYFEDKFARQSVTIINYHNPRPECFNEHIKYFSRRYSFISIDQLLQALQGKDFGILPSRPMVVTIDDGFKENARLFPILQKYHVPVVIYAVAGVIDTNRHFWFKKIKPGTPEMAKLKTMPDSKRREYLKEKYNHWDEKSYPVPMALNCTDLKELIALGGTVGSHTMFHPLLDRCSESVAHHECKNSKKLLEKILDSSIEHFALPGGRYNQFVLGLLKQLGYKTCRTTQPGRVKPHTSPLALPNFGITDNASVTKAIMQASGVWSFLKEMRKKGTNKSRL